MGAPTFKEQIAADISTTFLNCLEFADTHTVNGKEMAAVVDDNELLERDKAKIMAAQTEGTYKARRLVYVAKADFGPRPADRPKSPPSPGPSAIRRSARGRSGPGSRRA